MAFIYNICEVFYSFQGEGFLQGLPMVFVRMSGCNLRCSFCDTKFAFKQNKEVSIEKLFSLIEKYNCKRVCITGGEPFLQKLLPLTEYLKEEGYWLTAETNGTIWQKLPLDWLTVSPKKGGTIFHPNGYDKRFLNSASEFKYVIEEKKDILFIDRQVKQPIILQPVNNDLTATKLIFTQLKKEPHYNWYLKFQNHKIAGVR